MEVPPRPWFHASTLANQTSNFIFAGSGYPLAEDSTSSSMARPPCSDKLSVRRGRWNEEDDAKTLAHVPKNGAGNRTTTVAKKTGLGRIRWSSNCLRPEVRHESCSFTPREEELIIRLHEVIGSRWSIIAQQLPGRTDNDVKNHWNTKLKKKLFSMGIDPITHKPFSKLLADYRTINGGLPRDGARIGSLKNALAPKSEQPLIPQEAFPDFNPNLPPSPHADSIEDSFLNNNANGSLDLLAQLQAISLVAAASHGTSHSREAPLNPSPSFCWSDFLLEDPFPQPDDQQNEMLLLLQSDVKEEEKQSSGAAEEMGDDCYGTTSCSSFEASSSSYDRSFVEAMLDGQNDMLLDFPEEPFFHSITNN
ncbi:transcription factor MYB35-like [Diospyros lotus]|uniref:transcription factor MYB35-like n=1 Tax=Diospyros lotus TaxID=55363 RepID=UPI0022546219|nr:transcription factor MYB35-like [Diospyros lotus]